MDRDPGTVMDPRAEYRRRLAARRAEERRWARREEWISWSRLGVFLAGAVLAWAAVGAGWLSAYWLAAPVLLFGALVVGHERVIRTRARVGRAVAFYEAGLARLDGNWAGKGVSGDSFLDNDHPYARDLDLFGTGSLFELLCTARTRMGHNTLAAWLRAPAPPAKVRSRQAAVAELRPDLALREELAVVAGDPRTAGVEPAALTAWSTAVPVLNRPALRWVAAGLSGLSTAALLAWPLGAGPWPFVTLLIVQAGFASALRSRVRAVIAAVERPERDLALVSEVLRRFEARRFESPLLRELRAGLDTGGAPPSRRIAALGRLLDLLHSRRNQIFSPLAALALWATQCALALEAWRARYGRAVPGWLATLGQLEALASLAGHAYEHPGDPFPEIEDAGPRFDGLGVGHPFLPADRVVRNDVRLDGDLRLLVVSGSNMSGKSTLLRTVGINAVLAQAGGPVRAERLRLSPLAVGATLRIEDSLRHGTSRFYAEITRLRRLVEIADGPLPLLFLLDEILHGTNSHDRRIGADAVVRTLVDRGGIGLVTTHDLALSQIADELGPMAANVHFEDRLEAGRVTFDFRLRPGVVRRSNALELMRSVGLEI